jgi:hypothetical protein
MKKVVLLIFVLITITGCNRGGNTLHDAVQSQWKTPIEILNQNEENRIVIYLDQTQYVVGMYELNNGRYKYDNGPSEGMQVESEIGAPFFVKHVHFEGKGDFIYGAVTTEKKVEKVVLQYKNGQQQEIKAVNNTIIGEYPSYISDSLFENLENAYAYDKDGEVIASWN